jgi:hypothetical protein
VPLKQAEQARNGPDNGDLLFVGACSAAASRHGAFGTGFASLVVLISTEHLKEVES